MKIFQKAKYKKQFISAKMTNIKISVNVNLKETKDFGENF